MKNTVRKRVISGLLAGVMLFSNINLTGSASDIIYETINDLSEEETAEPYAEEEEAEAYSEEYLEEETRYAETEIILDNEEGTSDYHTEQNLDEDIPDITYEMTDDISEEKEAESYSGETEAASDIEEEEEEFTSDKEEETEELTSDEEEETEELASENEEETGDIISNIEEETEWTIDGDIETFHNGQEEEIELFAADEEENETAGVVRGTFRISGQIAYNETLDGTDWSSLVRPAEFEQPIVITQTYKDSQGNERTVTYEAQDLLPKDSFYLKFAHDGSGGGDFVIENVPKSVTDEHGVECQVTSYSIQVEPTLPYYKCSAPIFIPITNPSDIVTTVGTMELSLKSRTLTLQPTVIPESSAENPSFTMKASYTNSQLTGEGETGRQLDASYRPNKNAPTTVKVPVGIDYTIVQQPTDGYRLDTTYTTSTSEGKTSSIDAASGTIADGTDVTVSTVNYAQNLSVGFDVNWIDNNKAIRPSISEANFALQYKTADGTWKELTSEDYAALNITQAPTFDASLAAMNQYAYKGLPATDAQGHLMEYQVIVKTAPDGYTSTYADDENKRRTFTFEEQTDFSAQIIWHDEHGNERRPSSSSDLNLQLYRRTENGTYELVYDALPEGAVTITEGSSIWKVDLANLPKYNADNQEYDYVLVQGSIDDQNQVTQKPADHYKNYYDNGSGNFGNDISLCHNGGKITEVLYDDIDFQATKIWKDTATASDRPDSTVTLWRYVKGTAEDIDQAYENGVAAQVVFQTTDASGNIKENMVSYQIDKSANQSQISFTDQTVNGMPDTYVLPAYDDHGREYVYFVRESLSGANADDYEIQYSKTATDEGEDAQTVTYKNGVPMDGTITNVRRKKEAVDITKIWQNPSGLKEIEGVSVKAEIQASADGGKTYDTLEVYSPVTGSYKVLNGDAKEQAQTITGFSSSISRGEILYYVNTCNKEGKPYDMTTAQITETVTTKDGETYTASMDADGNMSINIDGQTYTVKVNYDGNTQLSGNMQQYSYQMTNTITADREYRLIKEWDNSIPDEEMKNIQSVNFKLERRTTKLNADGSTAAYETVKKDNGEETWTVNRTDASRTWISVLENIPRYDEEGYEYYYRATEISFTTTDGKNITTSNARDASNWGVEHYRTTDQTKAVNYKVGTTGRGYFTVSKIWQDNGDAAEDGSTRKNVQIRVYKRTDLKTALENMKDNISESDMVDLDQLSDVKYYEKTITSADQYTDFVYYKDLETAIDGQEWDENQKDSWTNYVVLEYCVGDATTDVAQSAQYTYQQLLSAAQSTGTYKLAGTVENATRKYQTTAAFEENNAAGSLMITNTRVGETSIRADKTWEDEQNITGHRMDSVRFQLYQDGAAYKNIPDTVTVEVETESVIQANLDRESGIITVSKKDESENTADKWSFTVKGLNMFSATGVPYSYHMDELADATEDGSTTYSYIRKKTASKVDDTTGKTQHYIFAFTNTITGTTEHIAYKYWKDASISAGNRPDLYMNLYRYLKKDQRENPNTPLEKLSSYIIYKDYKDQIWTTENEQSSGVDYEKGYNWKITVEDLPQFDSTGEEYGYVFRESMNNNGSTVLGTYQSSAETKLINSKDKGSDTYEVFTNTITDYMTLNGRKTWTGLSGYQTTTDDLPDPLITLYRTTDPTIKDVQGKTDEEIAALIENEKLTQVDTTHLTGSAADSKDKTRYAFPDSEVTDTELKEGLICMVDGTAMFPKFDAAGKRYTYLVRETIEDPVSSQLYSKVNTSGTLSNVFRNDLNRRYIQVTKTWTGRDNVKSNENKYPSVTYTLYRYEAGKSEAETLQKIETHTIPASEFTGENGTASYTFRDLLVYSPAGVQYCYYIVEKGINGYNVSYTDEKGITTGSLENTEIRTGQTSTKSVTKEWLEELKNNQRIDVISLPEKWNDADATEAELTTSVGTVNHYDNPGEVTISGEKVWDDYGDSEELRPNEITVTLTRHTNHEPGQSNKVDMVTIELLKKDTVDNGEMEPYIVWETETNPSIWKYTIYNLERYAPNGMPYIYTLAEQPVTGYKQTDSVTQQANSDKITMASLTNRFDGSYYVRKNWMDGNNKYNLRPKEITVKLQRSTDGGTNWNDIPWENGFGTYDEATGKWTGLPTATTDEQGKQIVSIILNASYVMKNTKNNSWEYRFTNLPTQDRDGKTYTYRCVETAIGGVPIEETILEDQSVKYTSGAYECRYTVCDDTKTVIENTLNATSLVVTKEWQGDQKNLYQTRPEKLTFVLQKRGIKVKDETSGGDETDTGQLSEWANVLRADGQPYTFTITPDAQGNWTTTLEDLPTAEVIEENGETYTVYSLYFRAVELHAGDTSNAVQGAQNYQDITDYSPESNAHIYHTENGRNESTITNKLILDDPARTIQVTKVWRRQSGESVTAAFELLYKTENETDWHCYGGQKLKKEDGSELSASADWAEHTKDHHCQIQTVTSTEAGNPATVSWTNLPKYDREGNLLIYKVVEHAIDQYKTDCTTETEQKYENANSSSYSTKYAFTNIELQEYSVKKIWQNTDYAEKTADGYTATFLLQQKTGDEDWTDVQGSEITLTSSIANDTKGYTWKNLPEYTVDGKEITYRAVETKINGISVTGDTNGAYKVSYQYGSKDAVGENLKSEPAFLNTETIATNRMIYGFVNLSKQAAYLATNVTGTTDKLEGVTFAIYKGTSLTGSEDPYVSGVKTDKDGHLIQTNGRYGTEQKYLAAGTYILKEVSTGADYSIWSKGVTFTVGKGNKDVAGTLIDTGEHGTAWISTDTSSLKLSLKTEYLTATGSSHSFNDTCTVQNKDDSTAVNLESRGVLTFTKTGPFSKTDNTYADLDTHTGASGESSAYFGVYLDQACTQQIAGMIPMANAGSGSNDKVTMVLTNQSKDGSVITEQKNTNGVPYLRAYDSTTDPKYPYTLLSGTYYIKELTAPAGYKLDEAVRKAVIAKLTSTEMDTDLSMVYPSNQAKISLAASQETGTADYHWSNEPNVVTLYKRDQYGRNVPLGGNGYLELTVEGEGNTFPSGENTIRLYQNPAIPATRKDGTTAVKRISYNSDAGTWTITGLLDIEKTYTLSEPGQSVHPNYIVAKEIRFQMNADGTIVPADTSTGLETAQNPLSAAGKEYQNNYHADAENNVIVMRDTARYVKDLVLEKKDSQTQNPIANISFELYRYEGKDSNGKAENVRSVLKDGIYLTTDSNGKIELEKLSDTVINQITGCALKYGLDVGTYYWKEIERGASDQYRLSEEIFFEIKPQTDGKEADYSDYATVVYDVTDSHVTANGKTVTVQNDPVTNVPKTLNLVKVDSSNQETKLADAVFTLTYQSINHGHEGSATSEEKTITWQCRTDTDGVLYLTDDKGQLPTEQSDRKKPDISKKGTYTLKEVQAPDHYMTRTDNGNAVTMMTFKVNSENQITELSYYNEAGELVTNPAPTISTDKNGEHITLNVTVKNEKTKVSVAKRNDIKDNTKSCDQKAVDGEPLEGAVLEIYEGIYEETGTENGIPVVTLENNQSTWDLPAGTLKENTIYTLHEKSAPVGYLAADDIYFKISGTVKKDNEFVSVVYVWNGTNAPSSVTEGQWVTNRNLDHQTLTMTDEAVIAPVDLQKVVGEKDSYQSLEGAVFEVKAGEILLGEAVSGKDGYLVWKTISTESGKGYNTGWIFNEAGKRVTEKDVASVIGKTIILQQNTSGYTFTETYAPDYVYNDGRSYRVSITAEHYRAYRTVSENGVSYQTEKYINLVEAEKAENYQVTELSTRGQKTVYTSDSDVVGKLAVNLPYRSTVTLHKYDGDEEGQKAAIPGTEFTLYRDTVSDTNIYQKAYADGKENASGVFATDANGDISIEIHEKGTYILKETRAAAGYQLDAANTFTFVLKDKVDTTKTNVFGYDTKNANALQKNSDGVPNERLTGEVSLTKKDAGTDEALNGVVYTLTRTDQPQSTDGTTLPEYLLKDPVEVQTGKNYKAVKDSNGKWSLTGSEGTAGEIHITGLNWGSYTLTEKTELSGYILEKEDNGTIRNTHSFTINGKLTDADGRSNALAFSYSDTNAKNQVTFYKTNVIDSEAGVTNLKGLEGAVFEVHEGDGAGGCTTCKKAEFYTSDKDASQNKKTTVTTAADGKVTIYGLPTDTTENAGPKTYHLVEVKAPKGYKLAAPVAFTIDRQGKVQIQDTNNSFADASPAGQVIMADEPIKLYIQKLGEDDTKLKGAEFTLTDTCSKTSGEADCDHKLANGTASEKISITADNGNILIPIERVIGGHTYTLTETKAPDGYECTAVVTFMVKTDGTIKNLNATGGYKGENGTCASLDDKKTTVSIQNEKIRMTLKKVDADDSSTVLSGVTFTLTPCNGSSFAEYKNDGLTYDKTTETYIFTTGNDGKLIFPEGLLKHDHSYLLKETAATSGYYLGKEAKDGVILQVAKDGSITVERLDTYKGKTITVNGTAVSSCPVTVGKDSSDLTVTNRKAATFDLTKKVEGNMGDLNGTFRIKMEVFEPDGTKVGERTVDLKLNQTYDSEKGSDNDLNTAFGTNAIPVGATLVITEDNELNYAAIVRVKESDGKETTIQPDAQNKGKVTVPLNSAEKISIELVNTKDVSIDVGVHTDNQVPWAAIALIIPAFWLAYRYRRKRKGGGMS